MISWETNFDKDCRIKFVGTVYDSDLLKYIRENAFGYLHGHSVGGTNPSLLEALSSTKLNLLYDVGFNREVGQDAALYWSKREGDLSEVLNASGKISNKELDTFSSKAKERIKHEYSWNYIAKKYNLIFRSFI